MCNSNKFRKILTVYVVVLFSMVSFAQIQPVSSHYMFLPQVSNPAFYGAKDGINLGANYRHQWAKLEGQPQTIQVFADAPLTQIHGALGLHISNDRLGAFNISTINVGYAFIQKIKQKVKIGIGIDAGILINALDGSKLITPQGSTGNLNDVYLAQNKQKSIRPNLTLGISLEYKFIQAGISYSNSINSKDKFKGTLNTLKNSYGGVFQTYISSTIQLKDKVKLKPSIMVYTDFKEIQTELSFLAGYKNYFLAGINARGYNKKSFESLSPIVSITAVKNLNIIYSYNITLNKLQTVQNGSHEITLQYNIENKKIYKTPKTINNPRFL